MFARAKMKVLLSVVLLLALGAEAGVDFHKIRDECVAKTGVSEKNIERAANGEIVDDPKVGETALCAFQKGGAIDEEGNIKVEEIQNAAKAGMGRLIDRIVRECAAVARRDTLEATAAAFFHCVRKDKYRISGLAS